VKSAVKVPVIARYVGSYSDIGLREKQMHLL